MTTGTSKPVCDYIFNKYLALSFASKGKVVSRYIDSNKDETNQRYYDSLGLIDTLGWNRSQGMNTYNFTCEGGCIWAVKTMGGKWLVFMNFDEYSYRVINSLDELPI